MFDKLTANRVIWSFVLNLSKDLLILYVDRAYFYFPPSMVLTAPTRSPGRTTTLLFSDADSFCIA